jgi:hypothetical protein
LIQIKESANKAISCEQWFFVAIPSSGAIVFEQRSAWSGRDEADVPQRDAQKPNKTSEVLAKT